MLAGLIERERERHDGLSKIGSCHFMETDCFLQARGWGIV